MKVLSLFDGMSCGRLALDRAGIRYSAYYASEVDKYSMQVSQSNFPSTVQLGDIENWWFWDIPKPDLIIAGSPCQGFSLAGRQLNFNDPRSKLFFDFLEILKCYEPRYFLLENVKMKKEYQDIISSHLGVQPVEINSALVSAQNRKRLYWANFEIKQPEDRGVMLQDIIEEGVVDRGKSLCLTANYYKKGNLSHYLKESRRQVVLYPASIVGRRINDRGVREDYNKNVPLTQCLQVKHSNLKMGCLTTVQKDSVLTNLPPGRYTEVYKNDLYYRHLTPLECERLQTVPEGYTSCVSDNQRYKMLGNGWTVEVIAGIFKNMIT